jgi:hypothetical protein
VGVSGGFGNHIGLDEIQSAEFVNQPRALAADLLGSAQTAAENLINRYVRPEQTSEGRRAIQREQAPALQNNSDSVWRSGDLPPFFQPRITVNRQPW